MTGRLRPIYFNGKFYAGGFNGVHRVADRLIRELDEAWIQAPPEDRPEMTLLVPRRRQWDPSVRNIKVVEETHGQGQLWEQFVLPRRARGGLLVNLCNLAPVLHPRKLLLLHDAQFVLSDNSYPARLRWGYRLLTPLMARTSDRVLTVSSYSRQMLDFCGVLPGARIEVLHNGADHILDATPDPEIVARLGLRPNRFVVHFASPKSYKNSAVIFAAFESPALAGIDLVLVGPGREELTKQGLQPPPGAIFTGMIGDDGLRSLYEAALCLAFPSRTEGFGLPPIEAMACGCPAVVSAGGAVPEVCHDAALYGDVDDPESWVSAFRRLADQPDLRAAKIAEGRRRAAEFTWKDSGRRLAAILLDAARS
jgi:glycosyltransferase involved in cell wall biosynthesis